MIAAHKLCLCVEESPGSRKQGAERKLGTSLGQPKLGQYRATETMSIFLP
jgi:hypothetical protein